MRCALQSVSKQYVFTEVSGEQVADAWCVGSRAEQARGYGRLFQSTILTLVQAEQGEQPFLAEMMTSFTRN